MSATVHRPERGSGFGTHEVWHVAERPEAAGSTAMRNVAARQPAGAAQLAKRPAKAACRNENAATWAALPCLAAQRRRASRRRTVGTSSRLRPSATSCAGDAAPTPPRFDGATADDVAIVIPVPDAFNAVVPPLALCATVRVAAFLPALCGWKITSMLQLANAATVSPLRHVD